jgi:long-chain acyl-CoA synthetase
MQDVAANAVTQPRVESQDNALARMCSEALARDAALPALEFQGKWVGWGQLRELTEQLTALIAQSGVAPDAPIVFVPHNRPSGVAALLGMLAQGRTVRMVYAFQSDVGIARDVDQLAPALVIGAREVFSDAVLEALRAHGAAAFALSELEVVAVEGFSIWRGTKTNTAEPQLTAAEIQILTSGTTGKPKRFGMRHDMIARYIVSANKNYKASDTDLGSQPPLFSYYPLGNISGIYGVLPTLLRGQRVLLAERFTVDIWRDYLKRHKPERASLPPAGFQMVLDAQVPPEELAGIRFMATGAAPLDLNVQLAFEARYGIPVLSSYGATEFAGPVASMTPELHAQWGKQKLGSAGRPIGGAQLRIVDADSGAVLAPGTEGLLEVLTPRIGSEWIRTSDLAIIDEDGFLFHRGRADGAIIRGGFKLLPETIERALLLHPAVRAVVVVARADARLGQVPVAAVQLEPELPEPSTQELERHVREHVYATHVPVAFRIVESLPLTASFKIDRAAVRELFEV